MGHCTLMSQGAKLWRMVGKEFLANLSPVLQQKYFEKSRGCPVSTSTLRFTSALGYLGVPTLGMPVLSNIELGSVGFGEHEGLSWSFSKT